METPEEIKPNTSQATKIRVRLATEDLWQKFSAQNTEMVVTKNGRKMFPKLEYLIDGMEEETFYLLTIKMALVDNFRYKFQSGEWIRSGRADTGFEEKEVLHSDGPMVGAYWMRAPINFENVKITNNPADRNPKHLYLLSMHKFVPVLTIYKMPPKEDGIKFGQVDQRDQLAIRLPITEFIAVTAYQNQTITNLKIKHNPFAKGFRDGTAGPPKR
ncbi:unnamed protein product, partial [Mesorhabditis spiculigera]